MARNRTTNWRSRLVSRVAGLLLCVAASAAHASFITIDVTGSQSVTSLGENGNTVLTIDLNAQLGTASGSRVTVVGIGWDVIISTFGLSWLSEAQVRLQDSTGVGQLILQPGLGVDESGSQAFSSGGVLDLTAFGLSFELNNGILVLAFGEVFNDNEGADAVWDGGAASAVSAFNAVPTANEPVSVLTLEVDVNDIGVPAPATILLMLGGLGLMFGRRRTAA